jgi:hypothetical protein
MPEGAEPLSVDRILGEPTLWVRIDTDNDDRCQVRRFRVVGPGYGVKADGKFIGVVYDATRRIAFHIFDLGPAVNEDVEALSKDTSYTAFRDLGLRLSFDRANEVGTKAAVNETIDLFKRTNSRGPTPATDGWKSKWADMADRIAAGEPTNELPPTSEIMRRAVETQLGEFVDILEADGRDHATVDAFTFLRQRLQERRDLRAAVGADESYTHEQAVALAKASTREQR